MYTPENNFGIYVEKQIRVPSFTMTHEHVHNYFEIFYLKTGSCIYYVNDRKYHLSSGDLMLVKPGDSHFTSYEGLIPCERIILCCSLEALPQSFWNNHPDLFDNLKRSAKILLMKKGHLQLEELFSRMMQENNLPDEFSVEFLQLLAMELFLCICRCGVFVYEQLYRKDEAATDIEEALRYIAQNYSHPITLGELAEKINLSPTYLSRKFKKVTGITFKEYVNYIRVRQACQALLTTDDSITKIAVDCGFNSSNYFKDLFQKLNGVSPRTFRKQAKSQSFEYNMAENGMFLPPDFPLVP